MSELLTSNHESRIGSNKSSFKTVGDGEKIKKLHTSTFIPLPSSSASASSSVVSSNNNVSNEKNKSHGEHKLLNGLLSKPLNSGGLSTPMNVNVNVSSNLEMTQLHQPQQHGLSASIEQILKSAIISSTKSSSLSPSSSVRNQYSLNTK
jgi:hypothetical protein